MDMERREPQYTPTRGSSQALEAAADLVEEVEEHEERRAPRGRDEVGHERRGEGQVRAHRHAERAPQRDVPLFFFATS